MDRCTTCQFYDRQKDGNDGKSHNAGLCRRNAPQLSPLNQKPYMIEGVWPTVRGDDGCGEWKASSRRPDAARTNEALGPPLTSPLTSALTSSLTSPLFPVPPGVAARLNGEPPRVSPGVRAIDVSSSNRDVAPLGLGAD